MLVKKVEDEADGMLKVREGVGADWKGGRSEVVRSRAELTERLVLPQRTDLMKASCCLTKQVGE